MAYTTLPTQSAGQTASAAGWANLVKANEESMMHLIVRKPSDEPVTSSTVLQNDDHLLLPVAANEIWHFRFVIVYDGATAGDIKIAFTFPTGGDLRLSSVLIGTADTFTFGLWSSTTSPSPAYSSSAQGTGIYMTLPLEGVFVNGANAGNLQLQWAQNASSGTATTVKANSTLWGMKLA